MAATAGSGLLALWPGPDVRAGTVATTTTAAAESAAAPVARRRWRSLRPARTELPTIWPSGGSGEVARSSSARSDSSSMTGLLLVVSDTRAGRSGAWLGCHVIEQH